LNNLLPVDLIDITFDFRSDTPLGKDPDTYSPTLLWYHQLLWSKPLPSAAPFKLDIKTPPPMYLHHFSQLGGILVVERCGDPDIHEVAQTEAHHRADSEARERGVQNHGLYDQGNDGLSGE
jgi:hypothetical protein